jgi:hypothetical protein
MDELAARAVLVPAPDVHGGVTTSVTRSQIEEVLAQGEKPIELVLDVTRFSDGETRETRSVAISWEPEELEQLLRDAQGDEVMLTFDRETLQQAMDADVEAHGIREKVLVLAVAATAAAGGAATASAMPTGPGATEAPIVQSGTVPDDRAVARGGPVESPQLAPDDRAVPRSTVSPVEAPTPGVLPDDRAVPRGGPVESPQLAPDDRAVPRSTPAPTATPGVVPDDRAVPRGGPVETPSMSPDDRAVPFSTPETAPAPTPVVSPDDRAFPRSPVETPVTGTVSDPGITWAPSPAETAALAGAIALAISGAYFVVGGRRRVRPGPA